MLKLLKVDFYKLFKSVSFRIIGIILIGFTVFMAWGNAIVIKEMPDLSIRMLIPRNFLDGIIYMFASSLSIICIAIAISSCICSEFSNGTLKNIISKGYARESVYLSKFIVSFISIIIYMFVIAITYLVTSWLCFIGSDMDIFKVSPHFVSCFSALLLYMLAMNSLSILFAVIFKKTWVTAIVFSGIIFFAPLLTILFELWSVPDCILTTNMINLIDTVNGIPSKDLLRVILVPTVYLVVSLGAGMFIFRKRDV